jgi:hypothetical protein
MHASSNSTAQSFYLWKGIFGFPFQVENLRVWLIMTFCMVFLAGAACAFAEIAVLIVRISEGRELSEVNLFIFRASWILYGSLALLCFVASIFPSAFFIRTVEDTAAGNDKIRWPEGSWYESLGKLMFFGWVFGCCASLVTVFWLLAAIVLPFPGVIWWGLILISAIILFPIPLFSTLIADSPWTLIHPLLLTRVAEKPFAGLAIDVYSAIFMVPCVVMGLWLFLTLTWWMAPIVGFSWAICILWYARALGRVGYFLSRDRRIAKKTKRKKACFKQEVD